MPFNDRRKGASHVYVNFAISHRCYLLDYEDKLFGRAGYCLWHKAVARVGLRCNVAQVFIAKNPLLKANEGGIITVDCAGEYLCMGISPGTIGVTLQGC